MEKLVHSHVGAANYFSNHILRVRNVQMEEGEQHNDFQPERQILHKSELVTRV